MRYAEKVKWFGTLGIVDTHRSGNDEILYHDDGHLYSIGYRYREKVWFETEYEYTGEPGNSCIAFMVDKIHREHYIVEGLFDGSV